MADGQLSFADLAEAWEVTHRQDQRIRALADRHYSRQTPGSPQFAPPGRGIFLVTPCARAAWVVVENLDPIGNTRWRCSLFRNEGAGRSSTLIASATTKTKEWWAAHYGFTPTVPLQTEVDPEKTRRKRDPGRCFRRAGWRVVDERRGLVVLEAP